MILRQVMLCIKIKLYIKLSQSQLHTSLRETIMDKFSNKIQLKDLSSSSEGEHFLDFEINKGKPHAKDNVLWELIKFAILALLIVIPIRIFIAQPFIVNGNSMVPTFEHSEYLIVDEISYRLSAPERGDVIVFRYPRDRSKFFIKRIIGLPNDTVIIEGSQITIKNDGVPDGFLIDEPFVKNKSTNFLETTLGDNEYFVMGDNRTASSDSRIWGPVERKEIVGRVVLRLIPLNALSYLPGNYNLDNT